LVEIYSHTFPNINNYLQPTIHYPNHILLNPLLLLRWLRPGSYQDEARREEWWVWNGMTLQYNYISDRQVSMDSFSH